MINLHSNILEKLNGNELAVFCHILKRVGKTNKSFPKKFLLQQETGFSRERVEKAIKGLKAKNIISIKQKKEKGKFSHTIYEIITKDAGVFINAAGEQLYEYRDTENRSTENRGTENRPLSIVNKEVIDNNEEEKKIKKDLFVDNDKKRNLDISKKQISDYKKRKRNHWDDYSNFYKEELLKSLGANNEIYQIILELLYGESDLGRPLKAVLSIRDQLSFAEFLKLEEFKKTNKFRYSELLQNMENYKNTSKNYSSLYLTIRKWAKR